MTTWEMILLWCAGAICAVIVLLLVYAAFIRWVTPLAALLHIGSKRGEVAFGKAEQRCRVAVTACAAKASRIVQGTSLWVRLIYLALILWLLLSEASYFVLTIPPLFGDASPGTLPTLLPLVPATIGSILGAGIALILHCVEFSGAYRNHPEYRLFPFDLSTWVRRTLVALCVVLLVVLAAVAICIALFRQFVLDGFDPGILDIWIVVGLAIPSFVATVLGFIGLLPILAAPFAILLWVVCVICAVALGVCWIGKEVCSFIVVSIERLNPRAARPVSALGPIVIDEERGDALDGAAERIGLLLSPPSDTPKEQKMRTEKYTIFEEVDLANFPLMASAAKIAAPVVLAYGAIDKENQQHQALKLEGVMDVSPTDRQYEQAKRSEIQGTALLRRLQESVSWNIRQVYGRLSGPAPLQFTISSLDDAVQMAPAFAQLAQDLPGLTHVVVAAPSPLLLATATINSLYQKADTLHREGQLDAVILYQPNSPLVKAKSENMQHAALQGFCASMALARAGSLLGRIKEFATVWSLAFATAPVPVGRALRSFEKGGYEAVRHFLKRGWPTKGYAQSSHIITQVDQLFERVVEERNTHTLDVPTDASLPLIFVTLLPLRAKDPVFSETVTLLQRRLKQRYPLSIGSFLAAPGIADEDQEEGYYCSVFCLFPVVNVELLPAPAEA